MRGSCAGPVDGGAPYLALRRAIAACSCPWSRVSRVVAQSSRVAAVAGGSGFGGELIGAVFHAGCVVTSTPSPSRSMKGFSSTFGGGVFATARFDLPPIGCSGPRIALATFCAIASRSRWR